MLVRYADPLVAKAVKESKTMMKAVEETEEAMLGCESPMARMVEGLISEISPICRETREDKTN